jgi:hypothetical protein
MKNAKILNQIKIKTYYKKTTANQMTLNSLCNLLHIGKKDS